MSNLGEITRNIFNVGMYKTAKGIRSTVKNSFNAAGSSLIGGAIGGLAGVACKFTSAIFQDQLGDIQFFDYLGDALSGKTPFVVGGYTALLTTLEYYHYFKSKYEKTTNFSNELIQKIGFNGPFIEKMIYKRMNPNFSWEAGEGRFVFNNQNVAFVNRFNDVIGYNHVRYPGIIDEFNPVYTEDMNHKRVVLSKKGEFEQGAFLFDFNTKKTSYFFRNKIEEIVFSDPSVLGKKSDEKVIDHPNKKKEDAKSVDEGIVYLMNCKKEDNPFHLFNDKAKRIYALPGKEVVSRLVAAYDKEMKT